MQTSQKGGATIGPPHPTNIAHCTPPLAAATARFLFNRGYCTRMVLAPVGLPPDVRQFIGSECSTRSTVSGRIGSEKQPIRWDLQRRLPGNSPPRSRRTQKTGHREVRVGGRNRSPPGFAQTGGKILRWAGDCAMDACERFQWRKWRRPVRTIAMPWSSQAVSTSSSRREPPG